MTTAEEIPETVVFDTEPLVAYFCDEPGSDTVETYIDAVMASSEGYISAVNIAEVHYIVRAIDGEERADSVVKVIEETGLRRVDTAETWRFAAEDRKSVVSISPPTLPPVTTVRSRSPAAAAMASGTAFG